MGCSLFTATFERRASCEKSFRSDWRFACGALLVVPGCFYDYMNDCNFNISLQCFYDQGGSGGTGGSPPGCVPSETNKDIDESCGAFVSPTGSDANGKGTREEPYLTIANAVKMKPRVYVCADAAKPFDEAVAPEADVAIYGGLDCANDWVYDPTKKSVWTAPSDSVPLTVTGSVSVEVYDFAITARDAEMPGGSSVAVVAAGDKTELALERCDVAAGAAKDGVTPTKPAGSGTPGQDGKPGADGCVDTMDKIGGSAGANMCDSVSYNGGPGGNGTTVEGANGSPGQPQPGIPPNDGAAGMGQAAGSCTSGNQGGDGVNGDPGLGATGLGTLTATGYQGATGADGQPNGTPGQGGGGGGGAKVCQKVDMNGKAQAGPGGGGGGAGGCPGTQPGKGGGPGGSSIGVASAGATVSLSEVIITTNNGGAGGTGGEGQSGGSGGTGGLAGSKNNDADAKACGGGDGGKGGNAGPGGGGLGGHSIGIAFTGAPPAMTKVVLNPGVAGPGGVAGAMNMTAGTQGDPGKACQTLDFDDGTCQ